VLCLFEFDLALVILAIRESCEKRVVHKAREPEAQLSLLLYITIGTQEYLRKFKCMIV
jgi:hypothetical protein